MIYMSGDNMIIKGIVEKEAAINGDYVQYQIVSEGILYEIVSKDKQAVKDLIFLRKGQRIEVDAAHDNQDYISNGSVIDIMYN